MATDFWITVLAYASGLFGVAVLGAVILLLMINTRTRR